MPESEALPFKNINDRLRQRWKRLLKTLAEQSDDFWVDLAMEALQKQRYDDALVNLYQAVALNPRNARALSLQGMALHFKAFETADGPLHAAHIRAMLTAYQQAVAIDPTLHDLIDQRRRHAYVLEFKRAAKAFDAGLEDPEAFTEAAARFDLAAQIRRTLTTPLPAPDTPWAATVNQALALRNAGRPDQALDALQQAAHEGDLSLDACLLLADLYQQQGYPEHAVALLERAWYTQADRERLEAPLLNAYACAGQPDKALPFYEDALAQAPDDGLLRYNYGTLLLDAERYDEAIEHLQQATRINPDHIDAQYNLGVAFFNQAAAADQPVLEAVSRRYAAQAASPGEVEETLHTQIQQQQALFRHAVDALEKARSLAEAQGNETAPIHQILDKVYQRIAAY